MWLVRLGALFLRTEPALALEGRRCIPDRLVEEHFKFLYTNLESALADLMTEKRSEPAAVASGYTLLGRALRSEFDPPSTAGGSDPVVRPANLSV